MTDMKDDSVISRFENMLKGGMDSPMLRLTLGTAFWQDKNLPKAIEHLSQAVSDKPDYSAAWKILGRAYLDDGQLEEAERAFESGLAAARENGDKQSEKEIGVFSRRLAKMKSSND